MARGSRAQHGWWSEAPWWAWVGIVVGAVFLAVAAPIALPRGELSQAEAERIDASLAAEPALAEAAEPPVAVIVGDSWVEGTGADSPDRSFPAQLAATFGWRLVNAGQGGTGYLDDGPPEFPERGPLAERVPEIVAANPDVVIVAAGINDAGDGYTDEEVAAAVTAALQPLRAQLPDVPLLVIGPFWPNGFPTDSVLMIDRVVADVAAQLGLPFLSPMGEQWITGSNDGRVAGNREEFIGPDGSHPTQAGHDYLAQRIGDWLATVPGLPAAT